MKAIALLLLTTSMAACGATSTAPPRATPAASKGECPAAWGEPPGVAASGWSTGARDGVVLLHAAATGTQNYACRAPASADSATAYAWTFVGPEATLTDCRGAIVATDGSTVVAAKVGAFTPDPTAVPWLRLEAKAHTGVGRFSSVATIERTNTRGGLAPTSTCDASNADAKQSVPYTADYWFFAAP
jgi:hypothetical protein